MRRDRHGIGCAALLLMLLCCGLPCVSQAQPVGGTMRTVTIDRNTSGDHTLVTGVAGKAVRVYRFELYCNGANNITVKDSTPTTLYGVKNFAAGQGVILDYYDPALAWMTGAVAKDLVLTLSANQQCTGMVWYTQG